MDSNFASRFASKATGIVLGATLALAALATAGSASAQTTGMGSGNCSSASSCSFSGTTNNGTPFSGSFNPATDMGTVVADSQPSQPLATSSTGANTFNATFGQNTFACSLGSGNNFTCTQTSGPAASAPTTPTPGSSSPTTPTTPSSSSSSAAAAAAAAQLQTMQKAVQGAASGTTRSQVSTTTDLVSTRLTSISGDIARGASSGQQSQAEQYYRGISAGSTDLKWGFWFDSSGSYVNDSSPVSKFDGNSFAELGGIDYNLDNKWLLGFTAGYVRTDVSVKAIGGSRLEDGPQFGPYISYIASSHITADLLFNYSRLSNSVSGFAGFDSNRYSGAANVNFFFDVSGWSLTGFMGYVYALENPSSAAPGIIGGMPTTIHYGAVKIGGEAAYPMGNFEPYVPLTVEYQTTTPTDGTGRGVVVVGAGVRYRFTDSIKGGLVVTSDEARSHSTNIVGAANLRILF